MASPVAALQTHLASHQEGASPGTPGKLSVSGLKSWWGNGAFEYCVFVTNGNDIKSKRSIMVFSLILEQSKHFR
jgi:hypothetical protein